MELRFSIDTAPALWLTRSHVPWDRLVSLGPDGFEAYARLRFIPDPAWLGQKESEVEMTADHPTDISRTRRALHLLAPFTSAPEEAYFCLWEGHGGMELPPAVSSGPLVVLPHRRYALLSGRVADIDEWGASFGDAENSRPPSFVWPADRNWCFTHDVDPHWAGIAGSQAAVDALVGAPGLDVVPVRPGETIPAYR